MKIKGQHGEFGWAGAGHYPVPKRQIEIERGEGISLRVGKLGEEREIMSFFIPGVLTVDWEADAKIVEEASDETREDKEKGFKP